MCIRDSVHPPEQLGAQEAPQPGNPLALLVSVRALGAEPQGGHLSELPHPQVGGHDDDGVAEAHHPPLRVGDLALLQYLQEEVEDCLLYTSGNYFWRYFTFQLAFIGWMLLCIVPFLVVTVFVAIAGPGLGSIALLMLMLIVFIAGIFAVSLYINAASVAFFNTAIDEYEQLHPDYSGFVPPHIPQTPGFPQEGGEQNYGQPGDGSYGQEGQDEQGPEIH